MWIFFLKQESTSFREVPVVIMSSENVLTRIDRWIFFSEYFIKFHINLEKLKFKNNKNADALKKVRRISC